MSLVLRIAVIVLCLLFLFFVARLVARKKLLLRYSLLWLLLALVILACAAAPSIITWCSRCLGFDTPSNFVFLVGFFFLLAVCLSYSVVLSKQAESIKSLVQTNALLEERMERLCGVETENATEGLITREGEDEGVGAMDSEGVEG